VGAFIVGVHPLLVELDVERDMGTGSLATAGLEVVQKRRRSLRDVVVLEVPERVEEGIGISVLGEADAQEMLDRVTAAEGDIVVVVSVPIASHNRLNPFGELSGEVARA
jgi:hypothetical protein